MASVAHTVQGEWILQDTHTMEDHGKEVFVADCKTASLTVLRRSLKELLVENELLRVELAGLKDGIGRAAELLAAELPGSEQHADWAACADLDPPASPPAAPPPLPAFAPASPQPPAWRGCAKRPAQHD